MEPQLPRYDRSQTYRWNYDHAPQWLPALDAAPVAGCWTFCGRTVPSPLGIAAGPLLNGKWILYYAALGFDVLTYKTVRSSARECYPLPNLQPVATGPLAAPARGLPASDEMQGSWAISFGMPSMDPDIWRADIEWTRARLAKEKLLVVSVVASIQADWTEDDLAADFAKCARWAVESGADAVETNFSCPNVATCDGQLYVQPAAAGRVAGQVRAAIGSTPYIIKIGFVDEVDSAAELLDTLAPHADALSMTNAISATVKDSNFTEMFGGQPRGIGGDAILSASVLQVRRFAKLIRERKYKTRLIGVGGIRRAAHVHDYLAAGAESVQLATAPMVDPIIGISIRREMESSARA